MKKFDEFMNESFLSSMPSDSEIKKAYYSKKDKFKDIISRIESYQMWTNGGTKDIEVVDNGNFSDAVLFKKSKLHNNSYYGSKVDITFNYNGEPIMQLIGISIQHHGKSYKSNVQSGIQILLVAKIAFNGNVDKAFEYLNKKCFSFLKIEINKSLIKKEIEDNQDKSIDELLSLLDRKVLPSINVQESSHFTTKAPNAKSDKEQQILDKVTFYSRGLMSYLTQELKLNDPKFENLIVAVIRKKSNPFRIEVGIRRDQFTNGTRTILSHEFFTRYKFAYEKLNQIYKELETIADSSFNNQSDATDLISFVIDASKIDPNTDIGRKIGSYSNAKKFNLF